LAEVKWIKLVTDVFDNRKIKQIEQMPDADALIVIWFKILCLAGNTNVCGMLYFTKDIPYTAEMLSTEFKRPLNTIKLALNTFAQFGMVEIIDNVLCVSNWEKYQNIQGLEKIREQTRLRVQKYRDNQRPIECNVTETLRNATDIDKNKKENKKEKRDIYSEFADGELLKALKAFEEMRNKIKKPLTDMAKELSIKTLKKLTLDTKEQIAIVNQSIEHCWQTFYEFKGGKDGQANRSANPSERDDAESILRARGIID